MIYLADTLLRTYLSDQACHPQKQIFLEEIADTRMVEDLDVNEGNISEM